MKRISCELLVAGGGVAGCSAAIAAARSGIHTLLAERREYLGGTGFAGMLQHICGLYLNGDSIPAETLNGGLTHEIVELLKEKAPRKSVRKIGHVYVLPYAANSLREVLGSLIKAETNATLLRNSTAIGVEVCSGNIRSVTVEALGITQGIAATMVLDCTGNGDIAAMSGAEFELAPVTDRQLAGFSIRVGGLKNDDTALSLKVPYYCAQAVARKILRPYMQFTTFSYGDTPDEGLIKMSFDGEDTPDRDERAFRDSDALLAYLGQVIPAFREARIMDMPLKVLDREGRRIIGDYMLTEEDVLSARKFPDALVKNAWPIELWDRKKGTIYKYAPQGDYYEIPFRCITVKGITNLLTAGRCISVSREALGSTRVMGACMALGEQAGKAAAHYIRKGEYPAIVKQS